MIRRPILIAVVVLAIAGLGGVFLMRNAGTEVNVVSPYRGKIRESFREQLAKTRLENTRLISAPITGLIGRIDLEPGDRVKKGQVLAVYDRVPFKEGVKEAQATVDQLEALLALLDDNTLEMTSLAEAEAMVRRSEEAVKASQAQAKAAQVNLQYSRKELDRITKLAEDGTVSPSALDNASLANDTALLEVAGSEFELASQKEQLVANQLAPRRILETMDREKLQRNELLAQRARAEAQLERAKHDLGLAKIVSPIDGIVLERADRGEKPVMAGAELLRLGNPADIELLADVLTEDALRLKVGGEVALESTAGKIQLTGRVKRIEPQGFTKRSSLGVEQQRVYVIIEIDDPPASIGVGYRLNARFFTGSKKDALIVPRFSVVEAPDGTKYVFAVEKGKLVRRPVVLGLQSDRELEIVEGLTEESVIVATPDSMLEEGMAVRPVEISAEAF